MASRYKLYRGVKFSDGEKWIESWKLDRDEIDKYTRAKYLGKVCKRETASFKILKTVFLLENAEAKEIRKKARVKCSKFDKLFQEFLKFGYIKKV